MGCCVVDAGAFGGRPEIICANRKSVNAAVVSMALTAQKGRQAGRETPGLGNTAANAFKKNRKERIEMGEKRCLTGKIRSRTRTCRSIFFCSCLISPGRAYECTISSHQLLDKFKFPVWSLYFDMLFGAKRYSLCLTLASSATKGIPSVGMNVSNVERMAVCLIECVQLLLCGVLI